MSTRYDYQGLILAGANKQEAQYGGDRGNAPVHGEMANETAKSHAGRPIHMNYIGLCMYPDLN